MWILRSHFLHSGHIHSAIDLLKGYIHVYYLVLRTEIEGIFIGGGGYVGPRKLIGEGRGSGLPPPCSYAYGLFFKGDLDGICDWTVSVPENVPTYVLLTRLSWPKLRNLAHPHSYECYHLLKQLIYDFQFLARYTRSYYCTFLQLYTVELQWLEHWWLVYHGSFELVFESLENIQKLMIWDNLCWFSLIYWKWYIACSH